MWAAAWKYFDYVVLYDWILIYLAGYLRTALFICLTLTEAIKTFCSTSALQLRCDSLPSLIFAVQSSFFHPNNYFLVSKSSVFYSKTLNLFQQVFKPFFRLSDVFFSLSLKLMYLWLPEVVSSPPRAAPSSRCPWPRGHRLPTCEPALHWSEASLWPAGGSLGNREEKRRRQRDCETKQSRWWSWTFGSWWWSSHLSSFGPWPW